LGEKGKRFRGEWRGGPLSKEGVSATFTKKKKEVGVRGRGTGNN